MPKLGTNSAAGEVRAFSIRAYAEGNTRTETFMGRDYQVVPVVGLVEGVVQGLNAVAPELALAEEFGRVPEGWDGRPVVMNHPVLNGQLVPANSPAALEAFQMGILFNSHVEDKKLKFEAWLDVERIKSLGGEFQTTLDRINTGETVEVSTGLFTGVEETSGRYNSKDYSLIWRGVIPDHLAFLSAGTIGACSIEDGCGTPRTNAAADATPAVSVPGMRIHESALVWQECGCKHKGRAQEMPGTTPSDEETSPTDNAAQTRQESNTRFHAKWGPDANGQHSFDVVRLMDNAYPDTMLDTDVRNLVNEALRTESDGWTWIIGFTQNSVIYETWSEAKGQYLVFQRSFDIAANNVVTLGKDIKQVHITMTVSPVVSANQGTDGNETTTETPTATAGEPDMPNEAVHTPETPATPPVDNSTQTTQTPATPSVQAQPQTPTQPRTLEQYISDAPPQIQAVLNSGLKMLEEKKQALIKGLKSTNRCTFTDVQLNAMDISVLEQLTSLANVPVYNGQNPGPREITDNADNGLAPPMPSLILPAATA